MLNSPLQIGFNCSQPNSSSNSVSSWEKFNYDTDIPFPSISFTVIDKHYIS